MYYFVGECSICGQGLLGIIICSTKQHILLMCDECNIVWRDLTFSGEPYVPGTPDFKCPGCDGTLASPYCEWATKEEIQQKGWWDDVIGEIGG